MVFFQEIYRKVVAMGGKRRTGYSTELPGANVYTVPCPIIHALNLIGGKWKLPVLWHLFDAESVRYNELKRSVVGITNIMLTQCLRELEAAGLVRRNDFGEVPPRVEYSLTGRGRELLPEMMLPEWNHDFLPTTMVYKLGWLPYLLLLAVLAVLLLWMLRRCACQQSQSGKLLALAVVLTLAVQSAFAAALNLGFVLFSAQLPLVTGNLHSMVDCALIGLALSAFRSESILRDAVVPVPRPPQTQTA